MKTTAAAIETAAAAHTCRWCYSPIRPAMPYGGAARRLGSMFAPAPPAPPAGFCSALCAARDRGPRIVAPMGAEG